MSERAGYASRSVGVPGSAALFAVASPAHHSIMNSMSYTLTMSGVIVGRSELEVRDADRRVARGVFRPGLGYELAQPVFDLQHAANGDPALLERYRRARDALRLELTDAAGAVIEVSELHIRRKSGALATAAEYVIEVESDDPELWRSASE